VVLDGATT